MNSFKNIILELIETLILSFVIIFLIYTFVGSMEVISGDSMEPNFNTGERILVDKITPHYNKYSRGEIVVLEPPNEPGAHYIKRVIGLPGDVLKVMECKIYISNAEGRFTLQEDYLPNDICTTGGIRIQEGRALRLGDNEYVVFGDNRQRSVDSRFFGPVTSKNLLGRVVFVFWPPKKVGFVN